MYKIKYTGFVNIFFSFILLELFNMGDGRFFTIGSVTLRMILYILALIISFFILLDSKKVKRYVLWLSISFLLLISSSFFIGLINGATLYNILNDIKPLLYFLMILPFFIFINSYKRIILVVNIIKFSSFFMMMLYLIFIAFIYFGFIDFHSIYTIISKYSNDFMFRGSSSSNPTFFYKGFLYLNIGFIFFLLSPNRKNKIAALLILAAIVLTLTRGFIVGLLLTFIFGSIVEIQKKKSVILLIIIGFVIIGFAPMYMHIMGNRELSDSIRIIEFQQVIGSINFLSFFIGYGFGIGVPIKPIHMEISYLEIFHKEGLLGLFFWFTIAWMILKSYINIKDKDYIVKSFFLSAVFVYMESLTNPFLNNPIGMGMILISLISLQYIKENEIILKKSYE